MRIALVVFIILFFHPTLFAQSMDGQWRGSYTILSSPSETTTTEYVLEITTHGDKITGSSYTYYYENGKRIYSICSISGSINRKQQYVEIQETKRIKTNAASNASVFQRHTLFYSEKNGEQRLQGKWQDVKNSGGALEYGNTILVKKALQTLPLIAKLEAAQQQKKLQEEKAMIAKNIKPTPKPSPKITVPGKPALVDNNIPSVKFKIDRITNIHPPEEIPPPGLTANQRRKKELMQLINIKNSTVKIDLYDNGEIDGDSISLYYKNKLILSHARLSDKPITVLLEVSDNVNMKNELVMYAENLGTIPPNTALMIITDGDKRYEVRMTSDLEKSASVRFIKQKL